MKVIVFFAILSLTQAAIDWDQVIPVINQLPPPQYVKLPSYKPRIVGGEEAKPNSIPYQAALFINTESSTYFCGGSLITPSHVLTAAHCVNKATIKDIKVVLGAHELRAEEASQQIFLATEFKKHERYGLDNLSHDIAIVKLPNPAILNEYVQLVTLPTESDKHNSFEGEIAQVSGWGTTSDESVTYADKLHVVESDILRNDICNDYYLGYINDDTICLSGERFGSSCNGDSGGPLVTEGKQIGIVSFGIIYGCEVGWPSGFIRVTRYLKWIADNTQ